MKVKYRFETRREEEKIEQKRTRKDLSTLQALPLDLKIRMTQNRLEDWIYHYGKDGVYVSFSGGKDSTVLLDIARGLYPDTLAVFVDTGLEYPEVRNFVKTYDNVEWLKPKKNFRQVIEEYGYPFISKEVSDKVQGARRYVQAVRERGAEPDSLLSVHGRFVRNRPQSQQRESRISESQDGSYP